MVPVPWTRIAILDGSTETLEALVERLRSWGFEVTSVGSRMARVLPTAMGNEPIPLHAERRAPDSREGDVERRDVHRLEILEVRQPTSVPLREVERRYIEEALRTSAGTTSRAARLLGVRRRALYRKIEKFGLEKLEPERAAA